MTIAGGLNISLDSVRILIASCPSWQEWTRADELTTAGERYAAALAKTHLYSLPRPESPDAGYTRDELQTLRPMVVVTDKPPLTVSRSTEIYTRQRIAKGQFNELYTHYIHIISDVSEEKSDDDAATYIDFTNRIGTLIDEMLELEETVVGAPYVQSIGYVREAQRCDMIYYQTSGDFIDCVYRLSAGLRR